MPNASSLSNRLYIIEFVRIRMQLHLYFYFIIISTRLTHHFDTDIYIEPSAKIGIGFGLAMEDSLVGAPYFYFSGYGLNGYTIDYTNFQVLEIGKWIVKENWKGAVLPLQELQGTKPDKVALFQEQASSCFL